MDHFNDVLSVIDGRPYQFRVDVGRSGQDDPHDQKPVWYAFRESSSSTGKGGMQFVVKVSSLVAEFDAQEVVSPRTHDTAIRFGLVSKALKPEESEFLLTQEALDQQRRSSVLESQPLKLAILRFIKAINDEWPQQGVGRPNLQDNFYNSKEELTNWIENLVEGGLFVRKRGFTEFPRFGVSMQSYKINPNQLKQREIEDLLKSHVDIVSTKVKIFMSYSHHDKDLAGKVKDGLTNDRIQVFMAHDSMNVSDDWEKRIRDELRECHVFMPLLTSEFRKSTWTDQEAGFALALNKLIFSLKTNDNPHGFLGRYQAESLHNNDVSGACEKIVEKVRSHKTLSPILKKTIQGKKDSTKK